MPVISARIDDTTFEKFKEYLKNNGIVSHSDFIKKTVADAVVNEKLNVKDYVRLAKECLDRIEALSSTCDDIKDRLLTEIGREVISGMYRDKEGRAVMKKGLVSVSITGKRNDLLKEYVMVNNIEVIEVES